jgi:hypothetical protein
MKETPQNITSEIIQDYPGRFILEIDELNRLLSDMRDLLIEETDKQNYQTHYLVGLKNGLVYETKNIETILDEENAQSLTIVVLIVFAELLDENKNILRSITVHFSRGKPSLAQNEIGIDGGNFNLNYHGISLRIKDGNRKSLLDVMAKIHERLNKFRRWYSGFREIKINNKVLAINLLFSVVLGTLLYFASNLSFELRTFLHAPRDTSAFLYSCIFGLAIYFVVILVTIGAFKLLNWLLPPSVIAIGDEIKTAKTQLSIRTGILWTVIIGGLVSVIVNLITR